MRNISNIPFDENVRISKESKVVHASSVGVGGAEDEIRIIICDKKLISENDSFKLILESDLQIVMDKKTAIDLKNLLDQYTS
ncbi:MAG: hypothetical protein IJ287_08560 [Methanobrevibacter sp.]|nr:hypothetical protein [Methanobrevibacter sp.]